MNAPEGGRSDAPTVPIDAVESPLVFLDTEGRVVDANRAGRRYGLTEEAAGRDFFRELLYGVDPSDLRDRFLAGVGTEELRLAGRARLRSASAETPIWLGIRSLVRGGRPLGVAVLADSSELTLSEERRKRAERLASVGELAAGVAHEVNNPLASIRSFAQLLARDAVSPEQQRALQMIVQETSRIARVIDNLLSFARQQGASDREPVNLSEVVEQVVDLQRYALETAGIEVRTDFDRALTPVMGEPGALKQVILNLVVNAEQALSEKEGTRLLILRTRESSEGVMVSVIDNGPGIPRSELPTIFSFEDEGASRGLGLGTCAAIVRDHAGHIWVESVEGKGAAFNVRFPRPGSAEASAVAVHEPITSITASLPPERPIRRSLRILVADDEPTLRLALALFLGRRGHEVTQAADAHEAFRLARAQEFDVALVDARMPGDGLALLEKLEGIPSLRGRTALMTGDLGRARTSQGITTGRPSITKPFDLMEVSRLLERLGEGS